MCVQICGAEFFVDYYANPDRARRLLGLMRELQRQSIDYFARTAALPSLMVGGRQAQYFCMANCTIPMTGPRIYKEWLLEYDLEAASQMARGGRKYAIHHCGKFDDFAELYSHIDNIAWLEIGGESDLRRALDAFPEARIQYIIDYQLLMNGTVENIRQLMSSLLDAAGPDTGRLSMSVPDIEYGTPEANVRAVVDALLA
jgi:hypothetical protein